MRTLYQSRPRLTMRARRARGWTLPELLVATGLLVVCFTVLYLVARGVFHTARREEGREHLVSARDRLLTALKADLRSSISLERASESLHLSLVRLDSGGIPTTVGVSYRTDRTSIWREDPAGRRQFGFAPGLPAGCVPRLEVRPSGTASLQITFSLSGSGSLLLDDWTENLSLPNSLEDRPAMPIGKEP